MAWHSVPFGTFFSFVDHYDPESVHKRYNFSFFFSGKPHATQVTRFLMLLDAMLIHVTDGVHAAGAVPVAAGFAVTDIAHD